MAAIYQSSVSSEKAKIAVNNPFAPYVDKESGYPLSGGKLYFGLPGRDGSVDENRKKVYAILESGGAIAIEQPVILSAGGVPQYNGNPVLLATDGSYSLLVNDSGDNLEYFAHTIEAKSLLGYSGVIPEESKNHTGSNLIQFDSIEASSASFYVSTSDSGAFFKGQYMMQDVDYEVVNESTIRLIGSYQVGSVILGRALDPTGQTVNVSNDTMPMFIYNVKSDALPEPLNVGDSVLINGGDVIGDGKGGSYLVVAGGTGTEDGYNYINLDNGNQLKIKSTYQLLKGYTEIVSTPSIASGKLTIDASDGGIFYFTVQENITNVEILNVPQSGELKIQLQLTQDPVGGHTVTWSINGVTAKAAGGLLPTLTPAADAVDEYILKTGDAGSTWFLFTAGQDIK